MIVCPVPTDGNELSRNGCISYYIVSSVPFFDCNNFPRAKRRVIVDLHTEDRQIRHNHRP